MMTTLLTAIALLSPARAETAADIIARAREVQRVDNGIQQMEMVLVSRNGSVVDVLVVELASGVG